MKVLLTHRYFVPDSSPYGAILHRIGKDLAAAGHEVEVFTSRPSYRQSPDKAPHRENMGDIAVRRIWVLSEASRHPLVRLFNLLLYCVALFFHTCRARADVVTAGTFPPVLAAWSASLAARLIRARFVYHVQDIHPEVSTYSNGRLGRGLPALFLRWLDNQTLRRADAIVTLSTDMENTLQARGLGKLPVHLLNNPALEPIESEIAPPAELIKPKGTVRLIFAGNMGRFQNLPLLADGVALCFDDYPNLELMFLGDGVALPDLKARWDNHPQVRFAPFMPFSQARSIIAGADIGLVSLCPNIYRVAYPSKITTYRELGLTVLALVEPESALVHELTESGSAIAPENKTPEAIAEALRTLLDRLETAPTAGLQSHNDNQPLSKAPASWASLLDELTSIK